MQSLNNLSSRGRKLLIAGITIFIILPLFYFAYTSTSGSDPSKTGTFYDKNSGQTVTNTGQQPETYGTNVGTPTYLGTSELFSIGVTKYQLVAIELGLFNFAKTVSDKPLEISLDVKTIDAVSYDSESDNPVSETSFIIQVDRKNKYKVRLQYSGISVARIYISSLKGEQLFDSKEIDGSKISE